jgi:hypothetical protein
MPLPKPRTGESRVDFVDRCIVDLNVVNDFRSMDQRIAVCNSLYEQEKEIKSVSENWGSLFESELKRAERESIKDFRDYYSSQYNKASAQFILTGNLNQADLSAYFQNNDLQNMYRDMYEKIGLRFANWYAKHWKKALAKATDINGYQSIWQAKFAYIGEQVGAQRVTLVAGTAKDTLIKITQQAMRDPQFMSLGDKEKARILRSQFDRYSDYQARRLVRTESTNAANFATMQSASDLFPAQEMNKVWITAIDGRERPAHHSANRQTVQFTKPFIVGGESLMHPGDSNGSAGNVINCRCSVAPIPRPNAQTIGEAITDIGFGMAQAQVESAISSAFITPEVAAVIATEVAVVNEQSLIDKMRPDNWSDIVPADAVVDDRYLALLKEKPIMHRSIKESFARAGKELTIDVRRFKSDTIGNVLSHEFGHIIHRQQGWINGYHSDPIVDFYFKKHQKMVGIGLRGDARMEKLRDAYYQLQKMNSIEFKNKFSYLTDDQYKEYRGAVNDFFGALTKNKIGWGHSNAYYRQHNKDKMEWMAHIFENKYGGNPLFKELFPEIYDETITILDELIATIK